MKLAEAGVDLLLAATLPAFSEATGLASALAATGKPHIVSFVVRAEGTLLDGTPLKDAIAAIDAAVIPKPLAYWDCKYFYLWKRGKDDLLVKPGNPKHLIFWLSLSDILPQVRSYYI